jgi:hypothetical protein
VSKDDRTYYADGALLAKKRGKKKLGRTQSRRLSNRHGARRNALPGAVNAKRRHEHAQSECTAHLQWAPRRISAAGDSPRLVQAILETRRACRPRRSLKARACEQATRTSNTVRESCVHVYGPPHCSHIAATNPTQAVTVGAYANDDQRRKTMRAVCDGCGEHHRFLFRPRTHARTHMWQQQQKKKAVACTGAPSQQGWVPPPSQQNQTKGRSTYA